MKRVLSTELPAPGKPVLLNESESKHLTQVFRLRNGDKVEALDGMGRAVLARINLKGKSKVLLEYETESDLSAEKDIQVIPCNMYLSVLKSESMTWAIEKCVELGVRSLTPVISARTVVKMTKKGPSEFQERWQRVADQSLKQCGRLQAMPVQPPILLENLFQQTSEKKRSGEDLFYCLESGADRPHFLKRLEETGSTTVGIVVGPEGGWTEGEVESALREGLQPVSLGPLTLRAETAALCAISIASGFFYSNPQNER